MERLSLFWGEALQLFNSTNYNCRGNEALAGSNHPDWSMA